MAIACVSIPHFALRVALWERLELDGAPLVLGPLPGARPLVADVTPEAEARGLRRGLPLREAAALCPEVVVVPPDPRRATVVAEQILAALAALSPLVEATDPGCWFVDLRGLGRRLGPDDQAATRLLRAVPLVLRPRVGIAPGKFVAEMATRLAAPGATRIVTPGEEASVLAPLPVAWLPLLPETVRRLERLGLRTMGDLAALPGAAVAARFGPDGRRAWELARGRGDAAVRPHPRAETVVESLDLPLPATSRETFLLALRHLALRAFGRPALRGRGVRRATVRAALEGGGSWEKVATLREPSGVRGVVEALRLRFGAVELPGPVAAITLELSGLTAEAARQVGLAGMHPRRPRSLMEAARQLAARYGASPLYRVVEVEPWSRIPERRHALMPFVP